MPNRPNGGVPSAAPRLPDRLRNAISVRHYSPRTAEANVFWTRKFVVFHGRRHPDTMGAAEVKAFPSPLNAVFDGGTSNATSRADVAGPLGG